MTFMSDDEEEEKRVVRSLKDKRCVCLVLGMSTPISSVILHFNYLEPATKGFWGGASSFSF